jgi:uncharacterized protein YlaN (UPF0358 family)
MAAPLPCIRRNVTAIGTGRNRLDKSMATEEQVDTDEAESDETAGAEPQAKSTATDRRIEREFDGGRLRVIQDRNDFFLPHVLDFIRERRWGNLRPEYQRRLRWDADKKSKLIESFVMNVPVPPVFLYEGEVNRYEVMDGQQRLNAISEFFADEFSLQNLEIWPLLNGRAFSTLPPLLRRGLERAKISAITLMTDSSSSEPDDKDLRAQVFERLNTGGEKLNHQELRNCLYSGPFNQLIVDLSASKLFTDSWSIPDHHNLSREDEIPRELNQNRLFSTMADCQIVLRYFAFRDERFVRGSTKRMLDECMKRNRNLPADIIDSLSKEFTSVLQFSVDVFGNSAFRLPTFGSRRVRQYSRPLYDAQMIALHRLYGRRRDLVRKRRSIVSAIDAICMPDSPLYETIVGRPNTASAISRRIDAVEAAILEAS